MIECFPTAPEASGSTLTTWGKLYNQFKDGAQVKLHLILVKLWGRLGAWVRQSFSITLEPALELTLD